MAKRRQTKSEVVDEEVETGGPAEEDYTKYRDKEPTDLQDRMADWVLDKVDPELDDDEVDAFREGIRLGVALRMKFQASPENQAVLKEQKAARAAAAAAEDDEDEEPKPKPKRKASPKARKAAEPVAEPEEVEDELDDEPEPEPAKPVRKRRNSSAAKPDVSVREPGGKPSTKRPARRRGTAAKGAAPF